MPTKNKSKTNTAMEEEHAKLLAAHAHAQKLLQTVCQYMEIKGHVREARELSKSTSLLASIPVAKSLTYLGTPDNEYQPQPLAKNEYRDIEDDPQTTIYKTLPTVYGSNAWFVEKNLFTPVVQKKGGLRLHNVDYNKDIIHADIDTLLDDGETTKTSLDRKQVEDRVKMNKQFQNFWSDYFGWQFPFHMCLRDRNYMTSTDVAMVRNDYVYQILGGVCHSVVDVFSGKGSDFFSWAMVSGVKRVFGMTVAVDRNVFYRNIHEFEKAFKTHYGGARHLPDFIIEENGANLQAFTNAESENYKPESPITPLVDFVYPDLPKLIDVLYMDPPWLLTEKMFSDDPYKRRTEKQKIANETKAYDIVQFLKRTVFDVLQRHNVSWRCMIIKGRWDLEIMQELADAFPGYKLRAKIVAAPFQNSFQTYVFVKEDLDVLEYIPGKYQLKNYDTRNNKDMYKIHITDHDKGKLHVVGHGRSHTRHIKQSQDV
jgi:hypothetical protein